MQAATRSRQRAFSGQFVSTLPIKPGYTTVEVQMPKDDDKRPPSEQEQ